MINMIRLNFVPLCAEWVYSAGDAISAIAVSSQELNKIFIYDGQGTNTPLHILTKLHTKPVVIMKVNYNSRYVKRFIELIEKKNNLINISFFAV